MAPPQLSEDEVDDLIYFARAGEKEDLIETFSTLTSRTEGESFTVLAILASAKDEGKNTCLHMAAGNGHEGIVKYLLDQVKDGPTVERQAFIDDANGYGNTALHWASMNGHLSVVKLLVDRGASPALANDKNYVPLDLAGLNDKVDVVDYFLKSAGIREAENGKDTGAASSVSAGEIAEGLSAVVADIDLDDKACEVGEEQNGGQSKD